MQGLFSRLFTSILVMSLLFPGTVLLAPDYVHAFGSLSENGTAAFMGIGVNPTKILHVSGTGPGTVPLFQRASDSAGFIIERTPTNRWVLGVNESPTLGTGFVLSTIPAGTQSVPRLMITQDGNVGIGTTSPARKLDVNGTGRFAGTLTTCNLTYSAPRTHYYSIPGVAFRPSGSSDTWARDGGDMGVYMTSNDEMYAPVYLPDGAVVTELLVYFYDVSAANNMMVQLNRLSFDGGGVSTPVMAGASSSGSSGYQPVSDTSVNDATINNATYGYFLSAGWDDPDGSNLRVRGARITYTISEAE